MISVKNAIDLIKSKDETISAAELKESLSKEALKEMKKKELIELILLLVDGLEEIESQMKEIEESMSFFNGLAGFMGMVE